MNFPEYHKINSLWKRDERGKIMRGEFSTPEFEILADVPWVWTEKVDGTNIRIGWDGTERRWRVGGRTERAQIPTRLLGALDQLIDADRLFSTFGTADAVLYGEGYGAGIQKVGGNYKADGNSFVLFDVLVGKHWLKREDVDEVADSLDLESVLIVEKWRDLPPSVVENFIHMGRTFGSAWRYVDPEGVVGTPAVPLLDRSGNRIITKLKFKDYQW